MFKRLHIISGKYKLPSPNQQRLVNGVILLVLVVYYLLIRDDLKISSDLRSGIKGSLLQILIVIFFLQVLFNRIILNSLLMLISLVLAGYFLISYAYFLFDEDDWYKNHFGLWEAVITNSLELLFKLCSMAFSMVVIYILRPKAVKADI